MEEINEIYCIKSTKHMFESFCDAAGLSGLSRMMTIRWVVIVECCCNIECYFAMYFKGFQVFLYYHTALSLVHTQYCCCRAATEKWPVCNSKVTLWLHRQLPVALWWTVQRYSTHPWQRDLWPAAVGRLLLVLRLLKFESANVDLVVTLKTVSV